ncbi:MAG TPA: hypothetical protein PLO67_20395 [Saprospiraceae bacterium]|nr:hypothetical protein [Saprospiraceae bacterium]
MKKSLFALLCVAFAFAACQTSTPPPASAPVTTEPRSGGKPMTKTTCYETHNAGGDITAIELTLVGDEATGFYAWEPKEKDGARGMFKGMKSGDQITAEFIYMIEGSIQTEEIVFKMSGDKLLKGSGELEDKNGKLVIKDKSKLTWEESFNPTDCANIKEPIARAVDMYGRIVKQQGN